MWICKWSERPLCARERRFSAISACSPLSDVISAAQSPGAERKPDLAHVRHWLTPTPASLTPSPLPYTTGSRPPPTLGVHLVAQARKTARPSRRRLLACTAGLIGGLVLSERAQQSVCVRRLPQRRRQCVSPRPGAIRAIVVHDVTRPIANFSYAIDRAIWGARPTAFHVTSVLLHMLNVVLLFGLAWRLAARSWGRRRRRARRGCQTEAGGVRGGGPVRRASDDDRGRRLHQRPVRGVLRDVVSARPPVRPPLDPRSGAAWAIGTVVLWIVALATKETAAMFPFVLAAYDWLHGPRARGAAGSSPCICRSSPPRLWSAWRASRCWHGSSIPAR